MEHWREKVYVESSSVQFISVAQLCPTLCDPMDCSAPGFPVHHQFPELAQTHVRQVSDAIQSFYPLLVLPSIFPSIRVFSSEPVLHIRWPEYWSVSFSISPSNPIEICGYKSKVRAVSIAAFFQIYTVVLTQRWNKEKVEFTEGWNFASQKQRRWDKGADSVYMKTT